MLFCKPGATDNLTVEFRTKLASIDNLNKRASSRICGHEAKAPPYKSNTNAVVNIYIFMHCLIYFDNDFHKLECSGSEDFHSEPQYTT